MWQLTWGPHARTLEARYARGLPTPVWEHRPRLREELVWVLDGFWLLCRTRSNNGFGSNPLSLESIKAYLDLMGIGDRTVRLTFVELVLALDQAYLKWGLESRGKDSRSDADTESR